MPKTITLTPRQAALASGDEEQYQSLSASDTNPQPTTSAADNESGESNDEESLDDDVELSDQDGTDTNVDSEERPSGDSSGEDGSPSWLKDGDLEYASSFGLTKEDLSQFENRADLQRFGRLTDQRALQQRRSSKTPESQDAAKQSQDNAKVAGNATDKASLDADFELVDPEKYVAAQYDEETVNLAKSLRKTQEILKSVLPIAQSITKSQESEQETQQRQLFSEFDKSLDALNDPLFGKTSKDGATVLPTAQNENRKAVWSAMQEIQDIANQAAISNGQAPTQIPVGILVERARSMLFADNQRSRAEAIKEQSKRRRPASGGNRGSQMPSGEADPDSPAAILKSPQIRDFWDKTQRQNGMR